MKWFQGNIPEAIQLAKNRRSIFVVYIYGDDELSSKLTESFNDAEIDQISVSSNCVAIQLQVKSEAGIQFSQIYPVVVVPCIFFIGDNGLPLEVAGGYLTPAELAEKFNNAIKLHTDSIKQTAETNVHQAEAAAATAEVSSLSASSSRLTEIRPDATIDHQVPSLSTVNPGGATSQPVEGGDIEATLSTSDSAQGSSSQESLEEKKERALELLAKKREEKARQEEEKEKLAEVERRKLGQEMARLRQWKEEREKKDFENSYKKQKEEDRLAREKVRADLERDRQERALRYRQEKVDKELAVMRAKSEKLAAQAQEEARQVATKRESARIQFRLPDGSSFMHIFPSSELLATCRTFVLQKLGSGYSAVTLSTIYPKRTFSETDMAQTLLDLELAPSAALVVLPVSGRQSSRGDVDRSVGGSGIMALLLWLLAPLLALWSIISSLLFGATSSAVPSRAGDESSSPPPQLQQPRTDDNSDSQPSTSAGARQRTTGTDGLKRHQDGNIRRFTANDDDDENATWNGNSTQQM